MAWQSLSHQASCDSLPVPALHLHSLWCHGRFSFWRRTPEHTPRLALNTYACTCVFTCGHPSVCLAKTSLSRPVVNAAFYSFSDDVFHKVKVFFSRPIVHTKEIQSQSWTSVIFDSLAFLFSKTNMSFCCLLVSVRSITRKSLSVNPYWAPCNENLTFMRKE